MPLDKITALISAPIVGLKYLVPIVRYHWDGVPDEWPVLIGMHRDPLLDFDVPHWHVDARFTTAEQENRAIRVIRRTSHRIGALSGDALACEAARSVALTFDPIGGPLPSTFDWKPRLCRRSHADAHMRCPATEAKLARKFGNAPCAVRKKSRLRCPHQGADVTLVRRNDDGTITCPMHGMRLAVPNG